MTLLVGLYFDPAPKRQAEFMECLRRNTANVYLEHITVFLEDRISPDAAKVRCPELDDPKIKLVHHGSRLTFADLFAHANHHHSGTTVIVANADIWFDQTLALLETEILAGQMLCLSRWEETAGGAFELFDRPDSQDAWIFEPPLPRIAAEFYLGKPGCDNRLAYEAEQAGLAVSNPSRSIRARHLHQTGIHRYTPSERLPGPTRLVPPVFAGGSQTYAPARRPAAGEFPSHRGRRAEEMAQLRCEAIGKMLGAEFAGAMPQRVRAALFRAVCARPETLPRPVHGSLARAGFREPMGYTLATLQTGVSTHNNDPRPLVSVPDRLQGLQFTQVVANCSAPVAVEFQTAGRLYVLASPGWEGFVPAAAFLDDAGWREPVEPLRTAEGTLFYSWTLAAGPGERLTVPTQVMLASAELTRLAP